VNASDRDTEREVPMVLRTIAWQVCTAWACSARCAACNRPSDAVWHLGNTVKR
jgi:hypothetical protein